MGSFDHDLTRLMGLAFDLAAKGQPQSSVMQEIMAKEIVSAVEEGERDPIVLANRAMDQVGLRRAAQTLATEVPIPTEALDLGLRLIKAFAKVPNVQNRRALVELAEKLAGERATISRL
jgi:hypothetical protein